MNNQYEQFYFDGKAVYIYCLIDPETNMVRYVGQTVDCTSRLAQHCQARNSVKLSNWVKDLRTRGKRPMLRILDMHSQGRANPTEVDALERRWVHAMARNGFDLLNTYLPWDMAKMYGPR